MATTIFPTIKKTIKETQAQFNFIERDGEGNLTETEIKTRDYDRKISKNQVQLELNREYPDRIVQVLKVIEIKNVYSMTTDEFLKHATKTVETEEVGTQTKLDLDESAE